MFDRSMLSKTLVVGALLAAAAPASAGTLTLAWDPNPETNIAGYRVAYGTAPGSHPTVVDVGNKLNVQIRNLQDGQKYYVVVMAYNTAGLVSAPSQEIAGNVTGLTALVSDFTTPTPTGQAITWTALTGTNSVTPYEFQFWRYSQTTGAWAVVQPYSPTNTFTWTPASTDLGTYAVQAWARAVGSTEAYESYRSTGMFTVADGPIKVGSLETNRALPASEGAPITWTAKAIGGPAPLQYSFWRYDERAGSWVQAQPFGASNTYTWTPSSNDLGRHAVQVWVKGAGSTTATFDAYRSTGFFDIRNAPLQISALKSDVTLPTGSGQPITWKATAAGGPGALEYQFWRFSQTSGGWQVGQAWGSNDTWSWTPTATGTYAVQVWVRRAGQTPLAGYEAYRSSGLFQVTNGTPSITALTTSVAAPFGQNAPVTFTANATGGPGPLEYRFWLYNQARDTWATLQNYSTNNTVTWVPRGDDSGTYALQAWVRRPASSAQWDAWKDTGFFQVGNTAPVISAFTSDLGPALKTGTPMSMSVKASGGPGRLEYRFWRYSMQTGQWSMVQEYSWDATLKWVPGTADTGTYLFSVWVRRAGSQADYETSLVSSPVQIIP